MNMHLENSVYLQFCLLMTSTSTQEIHVRYVAVGLLPVTMARREAVEILLSYGNHQRGNYLQHHHNHQYHNNPLHHHRHRNRNNCN